MIACFHSSFLQRTSIAFPNWLHIEPTIITLHFEQVFQQISLENRGFYTSVPLATLELFPSKLDKLGENIPSLLFAQAMK